ncbi:MAG: glutamine-hydrolyzing carbamoyl-phosphate synthase small subunit [Eubacteriaceae bacterium]|nr:glutamine-hydrolyzing carbamoyl-phosphate synthase small subunit [Eubacteriaceae bacterium]
MKNHFVQNGKTVRLYLENGAVFQGRGFGYIEEEVIGEVVFNTGMTGYQEVLTDPSYFGQIVLMTYPLIGNYGINLEDDQSLYPKVRGFIVKELCEYPNNFRYEMNLNDYLYVHKIFGMQDLDTRYLTKTIRDHGIMKGILTARTMEKDEIKQYLTPYHNKDVVKHVSTQKVYSVGEGRNIAVMDFGIKQNILDTFIKKGCRLTVFPYNATAKDILAIEPEGVLLSNGPGDPNDLKESLATVKELIDKKPVVGICLGHQLLTLATGGECIKLAYGHRGSNHPVKDLRKDRVYITSQNHGFVTTDLPKEFEITHINMNDGSVEGMKHKSKPIFSVQYHPEACPGPGDSEYIFEEMIATFKGGVQNA